MQEKKKKAGEHKIKKKLLLTASWLFGIFLFS